MAGSMSTAVSVHIRQQAFTLKAQQRPDQLCWLLECEDASVHGAEPYIPTYAPPRMASSSLAQHAKTACCRPVPADYTKLVMLVHCVAPLLLACCCLSHHAVHVRALTTNCWLSCMSVSPPQTTPSWCSVRMPALWCRCASAPSCPSCCCQWATGPSGCGTTGWTHRCRCSCHLRQRTHTPQVGV
jgi:hypothetical protein